MIYDSTNTAPVTTVIDVDEGAEVGLVQSINTDTCELVMLNPKDARKIFMLRYMAIVAKEPDASGRPSLFHCHALLTYSEGVRA